MGEVIQSVEFERQGRKRAETSEREQLTTPRFTDVVSSEKRFISFFSEKSSPKIFCPNAQLDLEQANMV